MDILRHATTIGGVSGGSITAAAIVEHWDQVEDSFIDGSSLLNTGLAAQLLRLTSKTIDRGAVLKGIIVPGVPASDFIADKLDKYVYKRALLRSILSPNRPKLDLISTNMLANRAAVLTDRYFGEPPYFFRPDAKGGYRASNLYDVGDLRLSKIVAASSAFPPFLAPVRWQLDSTSEELVLADGGIADNLALLACREKETSIVIDARAIPSTTAARSYRNWWSTLNGTIDVMHESQQDEALEANLAVQGANERDLDTLLAGILSEPTELKRKDFYVSLAASFPRWQSRDQNGMVPGDAVTKALVLDRLWKDAKKPPKAFASGDQLDTSCVSPSTRLQKLPRSQQVAIIQWGYIAAWAGISGNGGSIASSRLLNLLNFETEVPLDQDDPRLLTLPAVVERAHSMRDALIRDARSIPFDATTTANEWHIAYREREANAEKELAVITAQVLQLERVRLLRADPLNMAGPSADPRFRLPFSSEKSCLLR